MMCAAMNQRNRIRCAKVAKDPINHRTKGILVYLQISCLRDAFADLGRIVESMKILGNPLDATFNSFPIPVPTLTET